MADTCDGCGLDISAESDYAGQEGRCLVCRATFCEECWEKAQATKPVRCPNCGEDPDPAPPKPRTRGG